MGVVVLWDPWGRGGSRIIVWWVGNYCYRIQGVGEGGVEILCAKGKRQEEKGRRVFHQYSIHKDDGGRGVNGIAGIGQRGPDSCVLFPSLSVHPTRGSMSTILISPQV